MIESMASLLAPSIRFWRFHSVWDGESTGGSGSGLFAVGTVRLLTDGLERAGTVLSGAGEFEVDDSVGSLRWLGSGSGEFGFVKGSVPAFEI